MEEESFFKILITAIHPKSTQKKRLEAILELMKIAIIMLLTLGTLIFFISKSSNELSGMQTGTGLVVFGGILIGVFFLVRDIKNTIDIELPKEKKKVKIAERRKRR